MPYNPGISYRGGEYIAAGIASLGESIGSGFEKRAENKRLEADRVMQQGRWDKEDARKDREEQRKVEAMEMARKTMAEAKEKEDKFALGQKRAWKSKYQELGYSNPAEYENEDTDTTLGRIKDVVTRQHIGELQEKAEQERQARAKEANFLAMSNAAEAGEGPGMDAATAMREPGMQLGQWNNQMNGIMQKWEAAQAGGYTGNPNGMAGPRRLSPEKVMSLGLQTGAVNSPGYARVMQGAEAMRGMEGTEFTPKGGVLNIDLPGGGRRAVPYGTTSKGGAQLLPELAPDNPKYSPTNKGQLTAAQRATLEEKHMKSISALNKEFDTASPARRRAILTEIDGYRQKLAELDGEGEEKPAAVKDEKVLVQDAQGKQYRVPAAQVEAAKKKGYTVVK